jgi:HEAT repeat protein
MRNEATKKRESEHGVVSRVRVVMSLANGDKGQLAQSVSKYLADRSPRVRAAALDVVRSKELREMNEQVLNLLSDKNQNVRYSAVECLGSLHEGEAVGASWLYPLLQDPFPLVRIETLESLALIGDKKALPLIAERLQDDDALVRAYAARSIAELDGRKYLTAIERALKAEQDENAKVGFADALFGLGDEEQLPVILEFLSSADYRVRCAAANAFRAADLTPSQRQAALAAVSHAARNALFRADRLTMERVETELRGQ